jgi:hypothetical protein
MYFPYAGSAGMLLHINGKFLPKLNVDIFAILYKKSKYIKGVIRIRKSKDRPHNDQKQKGPKKVIRIRKSKDRPHNDQKQKGPK